MRIAVLPTFDSSLRPAEVLELMVEKELDELEETSQSEDS